MLAQGTQLKNAAERQVYGAEQAAVRNKNETLNICTWASVVPKSQLYSIKT